MFQGKEKSVGSTVECVAIVIYDQNNRKRVKRPTRMMWPCKCMVLSRLIKSRAGDEECDGCCLRRMCRSFSELGMKPYFSEFGPRDLRSCKISTFFSSILFQVVLA